MRRRFLTAGPGEDFSQVIERTRQSFLSDGIGDVGLTPVDADSDRLRIALSKGKWQSPHHVLKPASGLAEDLPRGEPGPTREERPRRELHRPQSARKSVV